ncbi:MAG: hypothetical protein AB8G17_20660, partial [Gammaproteobacteria bacterium]
MRRFIQYMWGMTIALSAVFSHDAFGNIGVSVETYPKSIRSGETANVVLTATNSGAETVTGVQLRGLLPAGIDNFSESKAAASTSSCSGGVSNSTCEPGEELIWNLGSLAPGQGVSVRMPPIISSGNAAPMEGSLVSFVGTVQADGFSAIGASSSVRFDSDPVLALSMTSSADPIRQGEVVTYTMSYSNRSGALSSDGVALSLQVPPGLSLESVIGSPSVSGGQLTWNLADLAPGQSGLVTASFLASESLADGGFITVEAILSDSMSRSTTA